MAESINERFLDFQIAQQIKWIRLQNKEAREALKVLRRVDKQLAETLSNAGLGDGQFTQARLAALKQQVTSIIARLHDEELGPLLTDATVNATVASGEVEGEAFKRLMPAGLDVTTPNLGVLEQAAILRPFNGAVMADWVGQLKRADLDRSWKTILDGIVSGSTMPDIVRSLNGSRSLNYKDGVREVTRRGTEALVRTAMNHATNQGRQVVWEHNSRLIKGVRWVATLDTRTTPICRDRDGAVGPVSLAEEWTPLQGVELLVPALARPPAHPNCRSTTVAITKSWRELGIDMDDLTPGTRASMDGQVPANMTYYQWLGKQTAAVQKDVLGPRRYDLWKKKGVSPDRFHNDKGELLTLDQIRADAGLTNKEKD